LSSSLLVSGFDLVQFQLDDSAQVLLPPHPLPPLEDFKESVLRALDEPLDGPPLMKRVKAGSRVCIVLDDPSLPVPPASQDARGEMLDAVLEALTSFGVKPAKVIALVANGLARQWRPAELTEWLGSKNTSQISVRCHDAEQLNELVRIADEPTGPVEVSRHLIECDLLIHLNVVTMPMLAGSFGIVQGACGYRTTRELNAPSMFDVSESPGVPGSAWHRAHARVGKMIEAKVPVLQVSAVLNNELWTPGIAAMLSTEETDRLSRPAQMWNALPASVRHRAARSMRSSFRPLAVISGPPDAVTPRALELFMRQHEVTAQGEADVLVFGLPDLGPWSVRTAQNPVLVANLALGVIANLFTERPLLRDGGAIVFANPLTPSFDTRHHRAHEEFYEKVLRLEREPEVIHERYEPWLASRPEFVADYQRRYAFHGAHALFSWYQCTPMRRRASRIIVAHGDPRACARLGFMAAPNLETALRKAKESVADAEPRVRVLELPPAFFVKVT
jgi:hypothetical protein